VQTEDDKVRGVPKWAWIVLIVLLPWVGPITWLVVGKDRTFGGGKPVQRTGPTAPDEDPEFLRKLDEDLRRERRERQHRDQGDGTPDDADGPTGGPTSS
jgi:Phospholipase_D-nuclease N-terminal